ncbi:hypothetical protein KEM56_002280 [Ascosphaera pollenicola]|nr:hypothetical protein KEM56_002280 [Ascosphaera pollenicola]
MGDIMDEKKPDLVERESQTSADGDAVLSFLKQGAIGENVLVNEKALLRKIDWMIMPLTWMSYNLQYMDKTLKQPMRMGIWYMGCGTAPVVGSLVAYGLLFYTGTAFKAWQILFLVFGLITIATGLLVMFFLPDNPMTCRFLSDEEKYVAIERLRDNKNSIENKHFKWSQFKEVWTDPQTYFLAIYTVAGLVPNGAMASFQGILINSMGFDTKQTQLLTLPGGVVTIFAIWITSWLSGKYNARILISCISLLIGIVGACMLAFATQSPPAQLAGNYLLFFSTAPLSLSYAIVSANYAGHTKKVTMNAVMLMSFCLGNILGPLTFRGKDAPEYLPAKIALIASIAVSLLFTAGLYPYYVWENRRRDKRRDEGEVQEDCEWMDLNDRENKSFRYSY